MFTLGALQLQLQPHLPPHSDAIVLPFRCYNGVNPSLHPALPLPAAFTPAPTLPDLPNFSLLATLTEGQVTHVVVKCDHMQEVAKERVEETARTVGEMKARNVSVGVPFFDMPAYRDVNRLFFLRLLSALKHCERCVIVVEKDRDTVAKLVQGVVAELSAQPIAAELPPRTVSLPPPPLFFPNLQPPTKRSRSPSPPSQSILRCLLQEPKLASSASTGNQVTLPEEDIMCIVCFEISPEVVTTNCCNGIICQQCLCKISACPVCRRPCGFLTCPMVRRLVNNLKVRCLCGIQLPWTEVKMHQSVCVKQKTGCPSPQCQKLRLEREELKEHIRTVHKNEVLLALDRLTLS